MIKRLHILFLSSVLLLNAGAVFGQSNPFGTRKDVQDLLQKQTGGNNQTPSSAEKGRKSFGTSTMGEGFGMEIEYQIHLLGQVEIPGTYRVTPSTRLSESIGKAQGISANGSMRKVELRRNGKVFRYDLFKFQRFGDLSQNPFLLDNDVIFVPYIDNNVSVKGPVKSSGVYELLPNEKSLMDLIQLSGGFAVGISEQEPITVVRYLQGGKKLFKVENTKTELENFELLNGDVVVIPHLLVENRRFDYNVAEWGSDNLFLPTQMSDVFVAGAVSRSGSFPYNPMYSVRDYAMMAGPMEPSNLRSLYVLTSKGKYIRGLHKKKDFHLAPGDTIFVPRRYVTTDNFLKWYNTLTSTVFTTFAFKELLK